MVLGMIIQIIRIISIHLKVFVKIVLIGATLIIKMLLPVITILTVLGKQQRLHEIVRSFPNRLVVASNDVNELRIRVSNRSFFSNARDGILSCF